MLISANQLTLGYRNLTVLRAVNFRLQAGEVLAVVGQNGSGKSTLIKTVLGVIQPLDGVLSWPQGHPREIAYLGPLTEFDCWFPILVRDLVSMGAWHGLGLQGALTAVKRQQIQDALHYTGMMDLANQPLHFLSSGQLQRALFARTMVQATALTLLDEPFSAVDQTTQTELLHVIKNWAVEGRAIILVVHDLSIVLQYCNKVLLLGAETAWFGTPESVLTPDNLVAAGYFSESQARGINQIFQTRADLGWRS